VHDVCRLAVDEFATNPLRDDVAIVALENGRVPDELRLELPADPRALGETRRVLRRWLRDHGAKDDQTVDITLAVSEACTNAIEHAYPPAHGVFRLRARADSGELTFVVSDTGRWRNPRQNGRGRGLRIIDAAMDQVQISPTDEGTEVLMRRRIAQ
jgi:anti-sigma regulatory factor (Ser/Thr protein kinase)